MSGYPNYNAPPGQRPPGYGYPQGGQYPPQRKSGANTGCLIAAIVVLAIGGVSLIVVCAGVGFLFYVGKAQVDKVQAKIKEEQRRMGQPEVGFPGLGHVPEEEPITNVDEAVEALNTDHWKIPENGAEWLITHPVEPAKRAVVVAALEKRLDQFNEGLTVKVIKALSLYGSKENAKSVARALAWSANMKAAACEVLAKWKDPSVAADIAAILNDSDPAGIAAERALQEIGIGCQAAVREKLDLDLRTAHGRAERVLASYGVDVPDALITARLAAMKTTDSRRRNDAVKSLAAMPLKANRQTEVARALDEALAENSGVTRDDVLKGLLVWGDKESSAAVARFVKTETFVNKHAVQVLVQLKDPETVDVLTGLIDNVFIDDREYIRAMTAFGADAGTAVLPSLHDERGRAKERARTLLLDLKTDPDLLLTQTLTDMESPKHQRVESAIVWLATAKIASARKKEVALKLGDVLRRKVPFVEEKAIDALLALDDPTAGGIIVELARDDRTRNRVSDGLKRAGPKAEDMLIGLLDSSDGIVQGFACSALGNGCGTEKCLKPIQAVLRKAGGSGNKQLTQVARAAMEAVQQRTGVKAAN